MSCFLEKHCLVFRKTLSLTVVADFVCLQATSAAAQAQEDAPWGTQETQPEEGDGDGEASGAENDDDDEANEDEEEEDEDDDEEDEEEDEE